MFFIVTEKKVDFTYYYLRALCYKQIGNFERARLDYMYFRYNLGSLSKTQNLQITTVYPTFCCL